ncbi:NAD-dependent DNA ligase [Brevundimonas vesicularis]|uniref:NAD-dependent DNA ligase n=1 Tax=Brevundimonas vesicularis TaxID=41276 RepID=A0A7W9L663_BREVE|nr:BRCT domain-containing protein [Brevundimonas vesicularis]MBB5772106.1 NAD-dependent DNA ligase [Brevundimonas vesicularis]
MDDQTLNRLGGDRLHARQVDELIGLVRGLTADGDLNQAEAEFLQKWLAANLAATDQPLVRMLYQRISEALADEVLDPDEKTSLLDTLNSFSNRDFELGEMLKASTLPLCDPAPSLTFKGQTYCFTGTFIYGQRRFCEEAVVSRGGCAGALSRRTNVLVIGAYATESWKHSSFGNKILQATAWREEGKPIAIVSEEHWTQHIQ